MKLISNIISDAPAPPIAISRKISSSERGIKMMEMDDVRDLEDAKRRLSAQHGSIEMSTSNASAVSPRADISLPAIQVRLGSAEVRESTSGDNQLQALYVHLPPINKLSPSADRSSIKIGSPVLSSHREESTVENDQERDHTGMSDEEEPVPAELFTPREETSLATAVEKTPDVACTISFESNNSQFFATISEINLPESASGFHNDSYQANSITEEEEEHTSTEIMPLDVGVDSTKESSVRQDDQCYYRADTETSLQG